MSDKTVKDYSHDTHGCEDCGSIWTQKIPLGEQPQEFIKKAKCPYCGGKSLFKVYE